MHEREKEREREPDKSLLVVGEEHCSQSNKSLLNQNEPVNYRRVYYLTGKVNESLGDSDVNLLATKWQIAELESCPKNN